MPKESEHDALRQIEDVRTARKRLGRPISPDQKLAHKEIVRSVSETFDHAFRDRRVLMQAHMSNVVDSCKKEGVTITPVTITIQSGLSTARNMQRTALLKSLSKEARQSTLAAGVLDFIKGFQMVMNALNVTYNPILQGKMPSYPVINSGVAARLDPKGFTFAKQQAKFWSNPDRISDGSIEPYEDPKLIAAGAKSAAKTYRRMYPIAERVLSSSH